MGRQNLPFRRWISIQAIVTPPGRNLSAATVAQVSKPAVSPIS
jgi:hypothetical protein